jgi:membrane protein DedA with SNARE-associated domain
MVIPFLPGAQFSAEWFYGVLVVWLFVESTGFPISDEPLLLAAGYWSTQGELNLSWLILLALIGKVGASCLAYRIGRLVPLDRLARPAAQPAGKWARLVYVLRPSPSLVAHSEGWFRRHGSVAVFLGRLVPVVRSFISYPAGAAKSPLPNFSARQLPAR